MAIYQSEEFNRRRDFTERTLRMVWLYIKNEIMSDFSMDRYYFAGGCVYSLYNDKPVKDYDVFCRNPQVVIRTIRYFERNRNLVTFRTNNAISVGPIQFITKYYGDPMTEVGKFDFLHNCYFYDGHLKAAISWDNIDSNRLLFNTGRARDALSILTRIPKFVSRGMTISQSEILKIIEQGTRPENIISERELIMERINHNQEGTY